MTIADIIRRYKPEMQSKKLGPNLYEVRIVSKDAGEEFGMTVPHQSDHKPTLEEVLKRLAKIAQQHEATKVPRVDPRKRKRGAAKDEPSFRHWCILYGADLDEQTARERYLLIRKKAEQLKYVLGDEAYFQLLEAV